MFRIIGRHAQDSLSDARERRSDTSTDAAIGQLPAGYRPLLDRFVTICEDDDRVRAVWLGGSLARDDADPSSDLDVMIAVADEHVSPYPPRRPRQRNQRRPDPGAVGRLPDPLRQRSAESPRAGGGVLLAEFHGPRTCRSLCVRALRTRAPTFGRVTLNSALPSYR